MIWIIALILVAGIAWLYKREMKKRSEWQMEYRYLTRHEKDQPSTSVTGDASPDSVSFSSKRPETTILATNAMMSHTDLDAMDLPNERDDVALHTESNWKNLQDKVHYRLRETGSSSWRRGQDWLAAMQQAVKSKPQPQTQPEWGSEVLTTDHPTVAIDIPNTPKADSYQAQRKDDAPVWMPVVDDEAVRQSVSTKSAVIDVPDLNDMVFQAAQADEQGLHEGYVLMAQEQEEWDRWSDDVEDDMRQEITLEEINARRQRLAERQRVEPRILQPEIFPSQKVIAQDDVAHVIRAIKEEPEPEINLKEIIGAEAVEPVIQSIKAEHKAAPAPELEVIELAPKHIEKPRWAPELEVIELPSKETDSPRRVAAALQTIGLGEIQQHQHSLQARAQQVSKKTALASNLETIQLPANAAMPKNRVEKTANEVIEFPNAVVKKIPPRAEPSLQTIVLTADGLQTVQAKEPLAANVRPGRTASDTALLHAMVTTDREQAMIADDDIRANLLRQRLARRRGQTGEATAGLVANSVIAEEEVLANLAKTDSPVNRQQRLVKPRPMVRDSVIPPTSRVGGEHGFKVKPQTAASAVAASAIAQPISSRFTPFAHPELQVDSAEHVQNMPAAVFASTVAPTIAPVVPVSAVATSLQAAYPTVASGHEASIQPMVKPQATQMATPAPTMPPVIKASIVQHEHESEALLPSLMLLNPALDDSALRPTEEVLLNNGIIIEEKLAEFKVNVSVSDAYAGPVITRYEIEPATGVRGSQVVNLEKDLARSLGFASIRVVETIPGKTCMGLELPNPKRQIIRLSSVLQSAAFQESKSKLTLVLGQDISGNPVVTDLAKAPHLLVAGTTGSGKSVGVNAMILSLLYKATPEEVRMIMIDPKMLELSVYEGIPHLLAPVVTDMRLAANALNWCVGEMEKRYRLMSHLGVRNVAGYNQKIAEAAAKGQRIANPFSLTPETPELLEKLPFIVVVVDEFADLMMTAGKKIEELIARLAQKARAAGIHLILATQRPSVDVITGLIKANIPTRIAFQVSSKIDSRTILDQMGAENLLGQGDMLFLPPGTGYPRRVHGAFVADDEVHNVVEYLKQFGEPDYVEDLLTHGGIDDVATQTDNGSRANEEDPLYDQAVGFVTSSGKTSISAVQRQLRIGYNRAARLVDQMEAAGVLSAPEHNGNRTLLVPQKEY